jgi:cGMP-dependent protein kinase 1
MSVKATTSEVVCLALGRENLISLLGDKVQNIAHRNLTKWAFEKDNLLAKLTMMQKEKVFETMKTLNGEKNKVILEKGTKCQKIIVTLDGKLIGVYN